MPRLLGRWPMGADWLACGRQLSCHAGVNASYGQVERDDGEAFDDGVHECLPPESPGRRISPMNADQELCGRDTGQGLVFVSCHRDGLTGSQAATLSRDEDAGIRQDGHSRY